MGTVHEWRDDEGWGTISSPDVPGLCWVHFSEVRVPGFRRLRAGQAVSFRWERAWQDGYDFVAAEVYRSGLSVTFDDPAAG